MKTMAAAAEAACSALPSTMSTNSTIVTERHTR